MTEYANPWTYAGVKVMSAPEGAEAFVYIITHRGTGKAYIGQKGLTMAKSRVVKGKKKKYRAESDWRGYYSSSAEIAKMIEAGEQFDREILYFCRNKGSASYYESREQFDRRVLENPDKWFNGIVNCRVHHSHVRPLIDPDITTLQVPASTSDTDAERKQAPQPPRKRSRKPEGTPAQDSVSSPKARRRPKLQAAAPEHASISQSVPVQEASTPQP